MGTINGLTEFLKPYVSKHKQTLIEDVLNNRTRYLTVVLENIYHAHNASAVVRSCDCFGVQDVHVIEGHNEYKVNPYVVRGAAKWMTIYKYQKVESDKSCFAQLKEKGYRLIGTSPDASYPILSDISIDQKVAIVFGTEETGLSEYAKTQMDDFVHIPMYGFTESLNISVSAAICLYDANEKIRSSPNNWQLSENEKDNLRLEWYRKIIERSDVLEREYLRTKDAN